MKAKEYAKKYIESFNQSLEDDVEIVDAKIKAISEVFADFMIEFFDVLKKRNIKKSHAIAALEREFADKWTTFLSLVNVPEIEPLSFHSMVRDIFPDISKTLEAARFQTIAVDKLRRVIG